ncbi:MAG: indolepyruvate ferredoxin oxidoreductase subunit alpha [Dehalococcoidales bacterium]|nr:indolepyruvate ferredoxin oxidoreductase subunit alpha [Dehalococcoidales bacterium]
MSNLTFASDTPGEKMFMLGNEAIARGAIEAGVQFTAAYPGTPSSEVTETLAELAKEKEIDMYVEWSVNEKVAFEGALAASICGLRSLACMKHVGVNVAHDPIMTAGYIGAGGGFVLLSAEDPQMWSSQNEQDNRYVAEQAHIPVLEPSSIQEAKDMMADAFRLSEQFKQIFMLRTVTRINHGRSDVTLGEINREKRQAVFTKNRGWLNYTPAEARQNKPKMLARIQQIREAADTLPYNKLDIKKDARLGIIACGLSYSYTMEALNWMGIADQVSVLKIGTPYPLPEKLVRGMLNSVRTVLVVEELEPFVETHVKAIAGEDNIMVKIHGKDVVPINGELSSRKVYEAIAAITGDPLPADFAKIDELTAEAAPLLPLRPPALCSGCPHRASHYAINVAAKRVAKDQGKDLLPVYPGDIGCYNLGYNPPQEAVDTTICMGGSFGVANGLSHIIDNPIVTHMGDSTFFHSGIAPLVNAVYNRANITMVIMDNSATAMTGFQPHPGTGETATGQPSTAVKIEDVAKACGVKFVEIVDPFDVKNAINVIEKAIRFEGPSVVVSRRLCAMIDQRQKRARGEKIVPYTVNKEKCNDKCNACVELLGCPAIIKEGTKTVIDPSLCNGCGLCAQICPFKAITQEQA